MVNEKRKYQRENIYYLVSYKEESGKKGVVSSVNISAGGVRLRTREKLLTGQIIELCINFLGLPGKLVYVKAEVVWGRKFKSFYKTGVKFVSIDSGDQKAIEEFIKTISHK